MAVADYSEQTPWRSEHYPAIFYLYEKFGEMVVKAREISEDKDTIVGRIGSAALELQLELAWMMPFEEVSYQAGWKTQFPEHWQVAVDKVLLKHDESAEPDPAETSAEVEDNPWGLSTGELNALKELPLGKGYSDIAEELQLSEWTIRDYVESGRNKLGVKTRTQAATIIFEHYRDEILPQIKLDLESFKHLTELEREVLNSLGEGFTNPEIAARLGIKVTRVAEKTKIIYGRLGVNRQQTGVYVLEARQSGLFEQPARVSVREPGSGSATAKRSPKRPVGAFSDAPKIKRTGAPAKNSRRPLNEIGHPPLPAEQLLHSAGVRLARNLANQMDLGETDLAKFRVPVDNPQLLTELLELEAISQNEHDKKQIGIEGLSLALAFQNNKLRSLLRGRMKGENRRLFAQTVKGEIVRRREMLDTARGRRKG